MQNEVKVCAYLLLLVMPAIAAPKPHSIIFGKWITVKWTSDDDTKPLELKVRPLIVDGRNKEWTIGSAHDVTEHTFVVQRAYRLNDALPQESNTNRWRWERGAWLLVDRVTGKVQGINLVGFDSYASTVSWFRDYASYCGTSDDGKKAFAIVMQLGRRKPLLKKELTGLPTEGGKVCPAPLWERNPVRVTFGPSGQAFAYAVGTRAIDIVAGSDEEDDP